MGTRFLDAAYIKGNAPYDAANFARQIALYQTRDSNSIDLPKISHVTTASVIIRLVIQRIFAVRLVITVKGKPALHFLSPRVLGSHHPQRLFLKF